jgi:hypothetical protein
MNAIKIVSKNKLFSYDWKDKKHRQTAEKGQFQHYSAKKKMQIKDNTSL